MNVLDEQLDIFFKRLENNGYSMYPFKKSRRLSDIIATLRELFNINRVVVLCNDITLVTFSDFSSPDDPQTLSIQFEANNSHITKQELFLLLNTDLEAPEGLGKDYFYATSFEKTPEGLTLYYSFIDKSKDLLDALTNPEQDDNGLVM